MCVLAALHQQVTEKIGYILQICFPPALGEKKMAEKSPDMHIHMILQLIQCSFCSLHSFSKNGKGSSRFSFPSDVTNNFNQANNLMLWWTLEHRAITICWGGLFYNWGENSNSTLPTTCHQSVEVNCLNFPRETAWWQLNEGQDDGSYVWLNFSFRLGQPCHRPQKWSCQLFKFNWLKLRKKLKV